MYKEWYLPHVFYVHKQYRFDIQEAEDIVSEQYYNVMKSGVTFENMMHIKSYMYRALRNACVDRLPIVKRMAKEDEIPEETCDSDMSNAIRMESYKTLYDAHKRLSASQHDVIVLLFWGGLTVHEVAKLMDISVSTVKNHKAKAIKRLRKKLGTTDEKAEENNLQLIKKIFTSTDSCSRIAKLYGKPTHSVISIKKWPKYQALFG